MKKSRQIAVVVAIVAVAALATDASAYYHPGLGVWMSRDPGEGSPGMGVAPRVGTAGRAVDGGFIPRDQYADGLKLYQYVRSSPVRLVDSFGLWGYEIHGLLTARLASMAGIACPSLVGLGAQMPDDDVRRPGWDGTVDLLAAEILVGPWAGRMKASLIAEWHFPISPNGEVVVNGSYARIKAATGIRLCDFTMFTEGLHVLQDS